MDKRQIKIILITGASIVFLPLIIFILIKKPTLLILLLIVVAALGYEWLKKKGIA
jgi:hypothetical protein